MLKILFGELSGGRLMRLPYLLYSILLAAIIVGFALAVVLAIGAGEHLIGGDLIAAQEKLRNWFTTPFLIIFGIVMALILFAYLNLMAKRINDIGLPGWIVVIGLIIVFVLLGMFISDKASHGLHTLLWLALLIIPSNAFRKN